MTTLISTEPLSLFHCFRMNSWVRIRPVYIVHIPNLTLTRGPFKTQNTIIHSIHSFITVSITYSSFLVRPSPSDPRLLYPCTLVCMCMYVCMYVRVCMMYVQMYSTPVHALRTYKYYLSYLLCCVHVTTVIIRWWSIVGVDAWMLVWADAAVLLYGPPRNVRSELPSSIDCSHM